MKNILVKDIVGREVQPEDAIILKEVIKENLDQPITLDFAEITKVNCSFFSNLFTDLFYDKGRDYIIDNVCVKNLSNQSAYRRVVLGTAF